MAVMAPDPREDLESRSHERVPITLRQQIWGLYIFRSSWGSGYACQLMHRVALRLACRHESTVILVHQCGADTVSHAAATQISAWPNRQGTKPDSWQPSNLECKDSDNMLRTKGVGFGLGSRFRVRALEFRVGLGSGSSWLKISFVSVVACRFSIL